MKAHNYGRLNDDKIDVWGVSPDHYVATYENYWEIAKNGLSGLTVSEQLYTARGMQGAGFGKFITDETQTDPHSISEQFLLDGELKDGNFVYFKTRPLWTVSAAPHYLMTEMPKLSRT